MSLFHQGTSVGGSVVIGGGKIPGSTVDKNIWKPSQWAVVLTRSEAVELFSFVNIQAGDTTIMWDIQGYITLKFWIQVQIALLGK